MIRQNKCSTYRAHLPRLVLLALTFALLSAASGREICASEGGVTFRLEGPGGEPVPMNITLRKDDTGEEYTFAAGVGHGISPLIPAGRYTAYISALWPLPQGFVPYVVDIQPVEVPAGDVAAVRSSFAEGGGRIGLPAYDSDFDGVIDRVELDVGTDPMDSTDIPGAPRLEIDERVLKKEEGWYRGEFRCYSTYSAGKMSVRDIVRRAERIGLDFIAITDRRTLEACNDKGYRSDKVLLIPAYEWGVDGHATLLGTKTFIKNWDNNPQVQSAIQLAHAQGVIFCITDPCSAESPWEWTVAGFHAMEVWSKDWRSEGMTKSSVLRRGERTRQIAPSKEIQAALAWWDDTGTFHACKNFQTLRFWDAVLKAGHRVTAVGGSGASERLKDIGSPVTYVYARELSVQGILEGIVQGRTFVTAGVDGPQLLLMADINGDNKYEGVQGSVVPIPTAREPEESTEPARVRVTKDGEWVATALERPNVEPIRFKILIDGVPQRGTLKLNIIRDGDVLRTESVERDKLVYEFSDTPWEPSFYRVELFRKLSADEARKDLRGDVEMLALTSPIYVDWVPTPEQPQTAPPESGQNGQAAQTR